MNRHQEAAEKGETQSPYRLINNCGDKYKLGQQWFITNQTITEEEVIITMDEPGNTDLALTNGFISESMSTWHVAYHEMMNKIKST